MNREGRKGGEEERGAVNSREVEEKRGAVKCRHDMKAGRLPCETQHLWVGPAVTTLFLGFILGQISEFLEFHSFIYRLEVV